MKKLFGVCLFMLCSTALWSAPVCLSSAALSVYDAAGFSCSFGGLTFSNFSWVASGSAVPLLTDDDILVNTMTDVAGGGGLGFTAAFNAAAGFNLDFLVRYQITSAGTPIIGNTLQLQGASQSGNGSLRVTETLCVNGTNGPLGPCNGTATAPLTVFLNANGSSLIDGAIFSGTVNVLDVVKDLSIQGGTGNASASLTGFSNTNSEEGGANPGGDEVPEPGPLALVGMGLAVTIFMRRRHRRIH